MTAFCNWKSPKLEEKSEEADQNTDSEISKQNRKYERQLQKLYKSLEVFNWFLNG